jgi:hypothetical protein
LPEPLPDSRASATAANTESFPEPRAFSKRFPDFFSILLKVENQLCQSAAD